ncbi:unnamed protein product [Dicrocoelium dendriticum]|nr:unnamed protein product [Dicrocoelium dendriticum]
MISRFRFIARLRRSFFPSNTYLGLTSPFGLSTHPSNWPVVYRSSSNVAVKTSVSSQSVATHRSQANVLQTIDAHRVSSLLLDREARSRRFSEMWDFLMSSPDTNILTVNAYLFAKLDCGLDVDRGSVLNDLQEKGLTPNTVFHSFISVALKVTWKKRGKELKQANLKPDAYIFSQILYGYAKAGLTEEVASVQELMGRLLLWPSRIAYESLLSAYAELGDHSSLLRILKEALEVLPEYTGHTVARTVPGSSPFSSRFLVNLYVQSNCFSTDSFPVCTELLTQLPSPPDVLTRRCVRGGVKQLLAHGQLNAALDLFAYGEPKNLDDPYLISLWRYAVAGGLGPDAVEDFWKLANVSGARLSALRRHIFRSKPSTVLDLRLKLKDAFARKDVDAVFATVKAHPTDARDTMCNYITQELLRLGLSPAEIIDRLQSPSLKSCAAFGSVLASLSADSTRDESISAHLDTVSSMISQFVQQGHLPMKGPIYSLYAVSRKILQRALVSDSSPDQYLCHVLDLLSCALSPNQLATVVDQMFASILLHRFAPSSGLKPALSADDLKMVQALVKACLTKGIQFPPDSWLFHSLESCELDKTELESLKFAMGTRSDRADDMSKKTPLWRTVQHELLSGNVNGVIELIKDFTRDSEPPLEPGQRTSKIQFPDVVNIAFDALTKPTKGSPAITATDVEHLFWACWDSKLLNQAGVAVARVASAYLRTSDFEGMAAYFQRASKQLGALQDFLLEPHFMKPLLEANFSDNLILLQSMASHPYLPITQFAMAAHNLAKLVALFPDKVTNAANWQHGSDQYWPVQVLSRRFSGLTHLGKLRAIHNAITDLCSSGRLQTAHSLRMWASQLGLLIFPKTNEHLTLTTQLLLSYDRLHVLPQSLLTHGLSQHHPVNLDNRLLASFDSTLLVPLGDDQLPDANAVKAVAGWLHEHILPNAIDADNLTARYLPTWLVICQRMLQSGSAFVSPKSWTFLSSEWLNGAYTMTTNAVTQLNDWYTYAASDSHKAALLLSALSNPNSQEWGLSQLRSDSFMIYRLLGLFDPASVLTVDQQSHLVAATAAINTGTISELAKVFRDPEVTVDALGFDVILKFKLRTSAVFHRSNF